MGGSNSIGTIGRKFFWTSSCVLCRETALILGYPLLDISLLHSSVLIYMVPPLLPLQGVFIFIFYVLRNEKVCGLCSVCVCMIFVCMYTLNTHCIYVQLCSCTWHIQCDTHVYINQVSVDDIIVCMYLVSISIYMSCVPRLHRLFLYGGSAASSAVLPSSPGSMVPLRRAERWDEYFYLLNLESSLITTT